MFKKNITEAQVDEMIRLYTKEKRGSPEIGKVFDVSFATVLYHLRKRGVKLRTRGGGQARVTTVRAQRWKKLYVKDGWTVSRIAKASGYSTPTVRFYLREQGVEIDPSPYRMTTAQRTAVEVLNEGGVSMLHIAKALNVSPPTVMGHLQRQGCTTAFRRKVLEITPEMEETLLALYDTGNYSIRDLARELKLHRNRVHTVLRDNGREGRKTWRHPAHGKSRETRRMQREQQAALAA